MEEMPACFSSCKITLKQASCDTSTKDHECMTESEQEVFDFDAIKGQYAKQCIPQVKPEPASNDALWLDKEHMIFIEFKNGRIDGKLNNEIFRKIYDSILMLMDEKLDISWWRPDYVSNISYMRKNMDYILVYNEDKMNNKTTTVQTKNGWTRQKELQNSPHRDALYQTLRRLGKQKLIHFGLDRFQGYLFRNVYTMSRSEFEEYMSHGGRPIE